MFSRPTKLAVLVVVSACSEAGSFPGDATRSPDYAEAEASGSAHTDSTDGGVTPFAGEVTEGTGTIPSALDGYNDPEALVPGAVRVFDALPLSASLPTQPWSGSYWPENKGGIAYRWRTDESFTSDLLTREEVLAASPAELEALSPAEKYDLLAGNYGWSLTKRVLSETSPRESGWTGICHGWAPASADYDEPEPITLTNPDGVVVPFGSSDIKALLSYFRGEVVRSTYVDHDWAALPKVAGTACGSANPRDPACYDTNPAAFHIVMTNRLGLQRKVFLFDADPGYQRWNQPAFAYQTQVLESRAPGRFASEGTVSEVLVRTTLHYTMEIEPEQDVVLGTDLQHTRTLVMHYSLELDAEGRMIGGQWQAPTASGGHASLDEVWSYLTTLDENGDGRPDLSEHEAGAVVWEHFQFPDYVWLQDTPEVSADFGPLSTGWELIASTQTTRQVLYDYFGLLEDLL